MARQWNEDEHAQFAVSLGYLNQDQANEWLAKIDGLFGSPEAAAGKLGPLLLEEGVIDDKQWGMMQTLMGKPASAEHEGNPDYELYLECKQAARKGDIAACEALLAKIKDPDFRYRAEIQAMKAQNASEQLSKEDE